MNASEDLERVTGGDTRAGRWRWWGAVAGLLTGLFDAWLLASLGVGFAVNGHDATLLIGVYFGVSFAALGFLLGTEAASLPAVHADADLICQVVLGLLANAVEAVPAGAEVTLEAQASAGGVEIAVADSGPGVPAELRARVFEPFFTTRPRGTGLGLAVARQIVEAHGGRIEVGERTGGGARFTLRLPAAA